MTRGRPCAIGPEQVPTVKEWLLSGVPKAEIAERLHVHRNTVTDYCKRHELKLDFTAVNDTPENRETAMQIAGAYSWKCLQRLRAEGLKSGEQAELRSRFLMTVENSMRHFNPGRGVKFSTYLIAGFLNAYKSYRRELKQQAGRYSVNFDPPPKPPYNSTAGAPVKVRRRRRVTQCQKCGAVIVAGSWPKNADKTKCPFCYAGDVKQVTVRE